MRKKFCRLGVFMLPLFGSAGCGGDDSNNKIVIADAPPDAPSICKAVASYSGIVSTGYGFDVPASGSGSTEVAHQQIGVEPLSSTDAIYMELNAQFGAFGSGDIKPGTYDLSGSDIQYGSCGVCIQLWPKSVDGQGHVTTSPTYLANERYMGSSGTVTLTMAGGGSGTILSGSLTNIGFKHVQIGTDRSQNYDPDNCSSTLESGTFSIVLMAGGGSAALSNRHF